MLSYHACAVCQKPSYVLVCQRTSQPHAFNAAGGLASGRRLASVGHVAEPDPGVGGRTHKGTWQPQTPPERSDEPRARGVRIGTWRSRTQLWGSESTTEDLEHFHLWDTWRHLTCPYVVE